MESEMYSIDFMEGNVLGFWNNHQSTETVGLEGFICTYNEDGSAVAFEDEPPEMQDRRIQARIADCLTALAMLKVNKHPETRKIMEDREAWIAFRKAHDVRKNGSDGK